MADWRQFVNEVILEYVEENSQQIGGKDCIVEIDESKFGKRKYNRGHLVEGQWVLVEWKEVQEWIKPGTTIYSDCWKSYATLGQVGYNHLTVNHSLNFVDPVTNCHTNTIEINRLEYIKLYCRNSNLGHHTGQANAVRGINADQIRESPHPWRQTKKGAKPEQDGAKRKRQWWQGNIAG
ncbi:putative transposase-like protein [Trichonephila clavipes]|nr:putative transposase-like protein [Trichonephila clavipes]